MLFLKMRLFFGYLVLLGRHADRHLRSDLVANMARNSHIWRLEHVFLLIVWPILKTHYKISNLRIQHAIVLEEGDVFMAHLRLIQLLVTATPVPTIAQNFLSLGLRVIIRMLISTS